MSTSEYWRKQGNDMVASAQKLYMQHGWEDKMKEAIVMYQRALSTALDDDERASASKNIGVVALKIADFLATVPEREKSTLDNYVLAVKSLTSAIELGGESKGQAWVTNLDDMQQKTVKESLLTLKRITLGTPRLHALNVMLLAVPEGALRQNLRYEYAETCFKSAVIAFEKIDHKQAVDLLKNCEGTLVRMKEYKKSKRHSFGETDVADIEIEELKANIDTQYKLAESLRCIMKGDECLLDGASGHESLLMGAIWQAVDLYQKAISLSEGISYELEARAQSRMGRAFYKVMKWSFEARLCFNTAMNLIEFGDHMKVKKTDWFTEMTQLHSEAQQYSYAKEDKDSTEIMEQLKSELEFLDEVSKSGPRKLLEFIYDRYNPKHRKCTLAKDFNKHMMTLKKALRDASIDFHPDKIDENVHTKRYKIMSREICKRVTDNYNATKLKQE